MPPVGFFFLFFVLHLYYFFVLILLAVSFVLTVQLTQQKYTTHAPGGIQTRNSRKRSAAEPRFRQLGHWDRPE
jgi:hypothetical protein